MADKITTLHPENDTSINLYPNVKDENIPNTIARVSYVDEGDHENDLAISAVRSDLDTEIANRKKDTSDTNGRIDELSTAIQTEATTRSNQITGLRNEVRGISEELTEEIANRKRADTALSNRIATNETNIVSNTNAIQAEATTRNNQITGLRDAVTGVNNALLEEVTNRENGDKALTTALGNKADYQELGNIWSLPEGATWTIRLQNSVKIGKLVFTHLVIQTTEAIAKETILAILDETLVKPNHSHLFQFCSSTKGINNFGRISNWITGKWHLYSYYPIGENDSFVDIETFFSVGI